MPLPRRAETRFPVVLLPIVLLLTLTAMAPAPADVAPASPELAQQVRASDADTARVSVQFDEWLVLGPVASPLPALQDPEEDVLLETALIHLDHVWPGAGEAVELPGGQLATWTTQRPDQDDSIVLEPPASGPAMAYLIAYVEARRFTNARLTVTTSHPVRVLLDDRQVAVRRSGGDATAELALTPGRHMVLVQTAWSPETHDQALTGDEPETADLPRAGDLPPAGDLAGAGEPGDGQNAAAPWTVSATLSHETSPAGTAPRIIVDSSPTRPLRLVDLLDTEAVSSATISPDGELVAVAFRQPEVPAPLQESWLEIRGTRNGQVVHTFRANSPVAGFSWSPDGGISYVTRRDGGKATLWVGDLDGPVRPVLRDVERFGSYRWLPDGRSIVYTVTERAEQDDSGLRRMRGLRDRLPGARNRSHLYQVQVASGATRRLTAGPESTGLLDISPDGARLLFTRGRFVQERPYSETELWELDLATLEAHKVTRTPGSLGASYSPDGDRLLVTAGPSAFDGAGSTLPIGTIPSDYDGQAYFMDRVTGKVTPLTRDFDPAVQQAAWSHADGMIYLVAQEGDRARLFRLDPRRGSFARIETGVDVAGGLSMARTAPRLTLTGSSSAGPPQVVALDVSRSPRLTTVAAPGAETFARTRLSQVQDWSFQTNDGTTIPGRVHLPPDYDPEHSYPVIVNYYAGVTPVSRSFGGRYPSDVWAGMGYVVYIPQPSGAIGWGQEYSARHVNNWGATVADEIIQGVDAFLNAHPNMDRERVGCIGASYGGFMTMLLTTQTDLFAACVSHAGISNITSYWGEGWWGYGYSAVATADSYPWNRPDIYVEQSPLFRADRITTPLLLLHGTADTNVPIGESEQLYTALKLLGRNVEYIRIQGEDHHILQYPKRKLWMETILAWFDKQLKGEPEWWEALHGKD